MMDSVEINFCMIDGSRETLDFCEDCPIYSVGMNPVHGYGNPDADIMFVGTQPGYVEQNHSYPILGESGERYVQILEELGLSRKEVYTTYIVKCGLLNDQSRHNKHTINFCASNWLMNEIIECDPDHVICLGKMPYKWLESQTGMFFPVDCKVTKFINPAGAMQRSMQEARLRVNTDKFKEKYLDV